MQKELGIWEQSQHLLEDRGKPRKLVSRWQFQAEARLNNI
jgi:hypothetical protein